MKFQHKNQLMRNINTVGIENYVKSSTPRTIDLLFKWSFAIKTRDKFRCQICGYKNARKNTKYLVAHHIFLKSFYPELALLPNNGITLCNICERQSHEEGLEKPLYLSRKLYLTVPVLKLPVSKPKLTRYQRIRKLLDRKIQYVLYTAYTRFAFLQCSKDFYKSHLH